MELDVIRRVLEEIKFKVERDINLTQLDQENYIVIVEALEKQTPKKIIETPAFQSYYSAGDESETLCPSCENELEIENQIKYCHDCGQKLDWEGIR